MSGRMSSEPMALFDAPAPIFDMDRLEVRTTNRETAAAWCGRYHYTGTPGATNATHYGCFAGDMVAVVNIAPSANEHGIAAKFGLTEWAGNREIVRVAVHPAAPRNSASLVIARVCKLHHAATGDEWLFSYADTGQGHHGGIYQALNAIYVGITPARHGYVLDGVAVHPRTVVHSFGTQAWPRCGEIAAARGRTLDKVEGMNTAKHTYVLPIGSSRARRAIRRALEDVAQPYPKRAA